MVLSVVVIAGLVGSGALGDQVARGLQRNEFGEGVVASLAILALGIALDRVTQGRRPPRERSSRGPLFGIGRKRQLQPGGGAV
jgi:glycine betaine/proline transport system permease protein